MCFKTGKPATVINNCNTSFRNHSEIIPNCAIILSMETPYISGLDTIELGNLAKQWFKWDKLFEIAKKDDSVKEYKLSDEAIHSVIYSLEDEILNSFREYADQLEESRKEVEAFLKGASWALGHKNEPEEF